MTITKLKLGAVIACVATFAFAPMAFAHQSTTSNGINVTIHVAPDDEPTAGQPATIVFVSAKRPGWSLHRTSCGCRIKVSDSTGSELLNRRVTTRTTAFTFPRSGAYRVTISGRLKRGSKSKSFAASFTYRAN